MTTTRDPLETVLDWADDVLNGTDPDNEDSDFCDNPRECAEAIAFDAGRQQVADAITALRAALSTPATEPHDLVWNDGDEESTAEGPLGKYAIWKSVEGWEASFKGVLAPQMYASREAAKAAAQLNYAATEPHGYVEGLEAHISAVNDEYTSREDVPLLEAMDGLMHALAARPAPQPAADTRIPFQRLARSPGMI